MDFKKMHKLITAASTVAITSHYRPDGDSVGSAVALRLALLDIGKKTADIFIDDDIPAKFSYMTGIENIMRPSSLSADKKYDLLIILDASSEDRVRDITNLRAASKKVLCIDHHLNNQIEADEKIVEESHASTGEILYSYFAEYKIQITKEMAEALYTSVATDTGCFMHASTTSNTHAIAAELMKIGINTEHINYINFKVYDRKKVQGVAYSFNNIKFFDGGKIAIIYLSYKIMMKYDLKGDTDRLKSIVSEAGGVQAGAFISEETKGNFHISLRSNGEADVSTVAAYFSGGGHKNASGFVFAGKYKALEKQIIAQLKKIVKD